MGARRNQRVLRSLRGWFLDAHLITSLPRECPPLAERNTHRIRSVDFRDLLSWIAATDRPGSRVRQRKGGQLLVRLKGSYPTCLLLDEGGLMYLHRAYRAAARLVRQREIRLVYSSFGPMADLLIGLRLKKRFPHLVWVVDFRDLPLDQGLLSPVFPRAHHRFMQAVLRQADILLTVSEGLAAHLDHPQKQVVRNGMDSSASFPEKVSGKRPFTLNYTGTLYPGLLDLDPILQQIRTWIVENGIQPSRFCLRYAGNDKRSWAIALDKAGLGPFGDSYDRVPHRQSLAFQKASEINLLLSWSSHTQKGILTGKFFEYLHAGNPVMGWVDGPVDPELEKLFEDSRAGELFFSYRKGDAWRFKERLAHYFKQWESGQPVRWDPHRKEVQPFTWEKQFQKLKPLLAKYLSPSSPPLS